ncbi:hypothetical protein [Bartonella sp. AP57NXGY]|uniref:hypothetical protein n=2 Tax=unclassified Bartonella TaxID=2645622 RepID=UPI0035D0D973
MVHIMLSFLGGGRLGGGELWGGSRYGKEGMKKRALYMGNCGRLCGGKLPAGSLGDKTMGGQVVIQ